MYISSITAHLLVSDLAFGTVTLKTSMQALYDTISLPNMSLLQLQITLAIGAMLTMISTIALTYFISAKFERVAGVISLSLILTLVPMFVDAAVENSWIISILPSGGTGLNSSLLM